MDTYTCDGCGALVASTEKTKHDRFHSVLNSHGWALAILKTHHLAAHIHDRYEISERIDSKKFDNWSADALAEVVGSLDSEIRECLCREVKVGGTPTGSRNWNPDCPVHPWDERLQAQADRAVELQRQAAAARKRVAHVEGEWPRKKTT